jgi:ribosome-associated protein
MPLTIAHGVEIPDDELTYTASRSGGPGGQHVNKTSSKVTLRFDVSHAPCLPDDIRARLLEVLGSRVAADGTVRVVCQASRSQFANRKTAEKRLEALLAEALVPVAQRFATKIPRAEKKRRIESKKHRGGIKRARTIPDEDEG